MLNLTGTYIAGNNITDDNGGGIKVTNGTLTLTGATVSGNTTNTTGGGVFVNNAASAVFSDCVITSNSAYFGGGIRTDGNPVVVVKGGVVSGNSCANNNTLGKDIQLNGGRLDIDGASVGVVCCVGGSCTLAGSTTIERIHQRSDSQTATVTISSGAIVDLTNNSNATPISPGGGITFASGGATVLYSSGTVAGSYMMDNVGLPRGAKLTNTAVIDIGGAGLTLDCHANGSASGLTLYNGSAMIRSGGTFTDIAISSASLFVSSGAMLSSCAIYDSGAITTRPTGTILNTTIYSGGRINISAGTVSVADVLSGGILGVYSGGTATNVTVKGTFTINNGGVASAPIISSGGSLSIGSGGSAVLVASSTGAKITVAAGGYITYK